MDHLFSAITSTIGKITKGKVTRSLLLALLFLGAGLLGPGGGQQALSANFPNPSPFDFKFFPSKIKVVVERSPFFNLPEPVQAPLLGVTTAQDIFSTIGQVTTATGQTITIVDNLIVVGEKIWNIVERGRPVVNLQHDPTFSVLPLIDSLDNQNSHLPFHQMTNWSLPLARSYTISFNNMLGKTLASLAYTVHFQFDGQYQGRGQYLSGVGIKVDKVFTPWMHNLTSQVKLINVTNHGTHEDPIAGLTLEVKTSLEGPFSTLINGQRFAITGAGDFLEL